MNASLMRLAHQAGIEPEYWDGLGMRRELGAQLLRLALAVY